MAVGTARRPGLWPALCCAALLFAILLANPFNEAGFNDDWSYGRVAMHLAQTGSIRYNGWGAPFAIPQFFWALPWIRIFGFSFPVLQAATVPVSLGFVLLVFAIGRRMGLPNEFAAFASLGIGTSPLFLPFAASFMTEAYGCFFGMACIYSAMRVLQATPRREATLWLWMLALAGLLGGASRQIIWTAPLSLIPWIVWERRKERALRVHAAAAYVVTCAAILVILHFFRQPYAPMLLSGNTIGWLLSHRAGEAAYLMLSLFFAAVLMSVPAFCSFLPWIRWRPVWRPVWCVFAVSIATILGFMYGLPLAPYATNTVTMSGIAVGQHNDEYAVLLPLWLRIVVSGVVDLCILGAIAWRTADRVSFRVFGVFAVAYLTLLVPGAVAGCLVDRYLLPLLPLVFLGIMLLVAERRRRVPIVAWMCLLLFASYGVATTHDYFARLKAQIRAARNLGVDRTLTAANFEYDGWTQLQITDYVKPVEYKDRFAADEAKGFWFEEWDHKPDLQPDYVVLNWDRPEPPHGGELVAGYRNWLPFGPRCVVAWKRSDLTVELQAARLISARSWR